MIRMRYIFLYLVFMAPGVVRAEWTPSPFMFDLQASFDQCLQEKIDPNDLSSCGDRLANAFLLHRAVIRAVSACGPAQLGSCPIPFEEEGLPAIAAEIALTMGCEASVPSEMPPNRPLPPEDCARVIGDILIDEGVVPLDADWSCASEPETCLDIMEIHARYWQLAAFDASEGSRLIGRILEQSGAACAAEKQDEVAISTCIAQEAAEIWIDLQNQDAQP